MLSNCTFSNNSADELGGGIYATAGGFGVAEVSPMLSNCTFSNNSADEWGGGIYAVASGEVSPDVDNSIFFGNTATNTKDIHLIAFDMYNGSFTHSIHEPGGIDPTQFMTISDTLQQDPMFIDAANGDLRLMASSPAIDTASNVAVANTLDLDGKTRILGPKVDMGAYEYGDPCILQNQFLDPNHFVAGEMRHFMTSQTIYGTNAILSGADIIYDGEMGVTLDKEFEVEAGAVFLARTVGCAIGTR